MDVVETGVEERVRFGRLVMGGSVDNLMAVEWRSDIVNEKCCCPGELDVLQLPIYAIAARAPSVQATLVARWLLDRKELQVVVDQFTALHCAAMEGNEPLARLLLENHPNLLEQKTHAGLTAIDLACAAGSLSVFRLLTASKATVDRAEKLLWISVDYAPDDDDWKERQSLMLALINEYKIDLSARDESNDHSNVFHKLARKTVPPSLWQDLLPLLSDHSVLSHGQEYGNTPAHLAALHHQSDNLVVLSKMAPHSIFKTNNDRMYPHHLLFMQQLPTDLSTDDECRWLSRADLARRTLFKILGCQNGCTLVDVNKPLFVNGDTLLHLAIRAHAGFSVIDLLLSGGADVYIVNADGINALELGMSDYPALVTHWFRKQETEIKSLRQHIQTQTRNQPAAYQLFHYPNPATTSQSDSLFHHPDY
jgi:ankyrin repeat protein